MILHYCLPLSRELQWQTEAKSVKVLDEAKKVSMEAKTRLKTKRNCLCWFASLFPRSLLCLRTCSLTSVKTVLPECKKRGKLQSCSNTQQTWKITTSKICRNSSQNPFIKEVQEKSTGKVHSHFSFPGLFYILFFQWRRQFGYLQNCNDSQWSLDL